jgi:hypothetical protein
MMNMLDNAVQSNPLMNNLQRVVTIPKKVNMEQPQYHLVSESHVKQETNVINGSDGAMRKLKK